MLISTLICRNYSLIVKCVKWYGFKWFKNADSNKCVILPQALDVMQNWNDENQQTHKIFQPHAEGYRRAFYISCQKIRNIHESFLKVE